MLPKKNKTGVFLTLAAACLLAGCSSPASEVGGKTVKKKLPFKETPLYRISTNGDMTNILEYYQPAGSENVYFFDASLNGVRVLNTTDGSFRLVAVLSDLPADYEGVFTVDERTRRLHFFTPDSIVDYTLRGNRTGSMAIPQGDGYIWASSRWFPPLFKNGKLYISYFRKIEGSFRDPDYFKGAVEAEIDLATKKVKYFGGYPAAYQEHCYSYAYHPNRLETGAQTHGYVFPHSDSIYLYDLKTGDRSARFFGVTEHKPFVYISFEKIRSLHETALTEAVRANPQQYYSVISAPLAGYYVRELVIRPKMEGGEYGQIFSVFDRKLHYLGESAKPLGLLADSRRGILSVTLEDDQLIVNKVSW